MIGLALALAFAYEVELDAMTDEATHIARLGQGNATISVLCGKATSGRLAVSFEVPRSLHEFYGSKARVQWRFDDGEPDKDWAIWGTRRATLIGDKAASFADGAARSERIRVQFTAAYDGDVVFDTPASDPDDAIRRVIENCQRR